jgi:hypothetical protein
MRQSGRALRKLIRSVAAAELWIGGVGKYQERNASRRNQSLTGWKTAWDRPLIGPGKHALNVSCSAGQDWEYNLEFHGFHLIMSELFDSLDEGIQQSVWGMLDDKLEMDFDFVKIVVFEIDESSFKEKNFDNMTPLFWVDRQSDLPPSSAISDDEKLWIEKYLGPDEASVVVGEFGAEGTRSALLYLDLDDSGLQELTAYTAEVSNEDEDEDEDEDCD